MPNQSNLRNDFSSDLTSVDIENLPLRSALSWKKRISSNKNPFSIPYQEGNTPTQTSQPNPSAIPSPNQPIVSSASPHLVLKLKNKPSLKGKIFNWGMTAFSLFLFLVIVALPLLYFLYFKPKITILRYSKKYLSLLTSFSQSLKKVDSQLNQLSNFVISGAPSLPTKSEVEARQNLNLAPDKAKYLSEDSRITGVKTFFSFAAINAYLPIEQKLIPFLKLWGKGEKRIAGLETGEDPAIINVRTMREYSQKCQEEIQNSLLVLDKLQVNVDSLENLPITRQSNQGLKEVVNDGQNYLNQAQKICHYYLEIAEVELEIYPATISLVGLVYDLALTENPELHLNRLAEIEAKFQDQEKVIDSMPQEEIPSGMENLHQDNRQTVALILEFTGRIKSAIEGTNKKVLLEASEKFTSDSTVITDRARTQEVTFWQNCQTLRNFASLSSRLSQLKSQLQKIKDENQVPIVENNQPLLKFLLGEDSGN